MPIPDTLPLGQRVFIIAEAGVNHNGDVDLAMKLIDVAAEAGADAVKFQTWKPGEITGRFAYKVPYLEQSTSPDESRYELSRRLALPYDAFRKISVHADRRGILFLSTPDGFESLDFLVSELNIPFIKVGSTEVTHVQFLEAVGRKDRPVILSTGLSNLGEVEKAVGTIRQFTQKSLVLLHCTSEYPANYSEINLRAMVTLRNAFHLPVGFSDHSVGKEAGIAAVSLGAEIIEKHFTTDKTLEGPDHQASMDPSELKDFIRSIRITEQVLGDGLKRMTPSEKRNVIGIRRSIVARHPISKYTVLSREMLTCKRPGNGLSPGFMDCVIGMRTNKNLEEDEPLLWDYLK